MLFSGKENVFMCLVVFQKIFRKIFSGVWKMLQGKDKPISTLDKTQIDARCSRSRRTGQTHHDRARWSRSREAPRRFARSRTARSASPSLSLSLWNSFEVKIGMEIHFRSQSLFFSVNGNQFSENSIFRTNQTPAFLEKHFQKWFSPKTNTALL